MAKVLIVENERIVAKDIESTLRRLGHSVAATAASADEAIRLAEEHRPDLVLMDISLEGPRDGIAAAKEIGGRLSTAVVYLTAYADDDTVSRARETAPYGYLVKPFNERELHGTIEVALHRHETEALLRQQERFLSLGTIAVGIAHEINHPLNFVIANLGLASQEVASASSEIVAIPISPACIAVPVARLRTASVAIDDASVGGERVRAIVADLKIFARADDAPRTAIELWPALEAALRLCGGQIRHRAQLVREPGPVPRVRANSARLEQVFVNLLVNAAQAIPEDEPATNFIRVATRTDDAGRAVIEIEDTGRGIAAEDLPRIFDQFFTTKPVGVGTGLGLSICHGLIAALDGEIAVESPRQQGALFRITLPAAAPDLPAPPLPSAPPRATLPAAPRARLLAIDDEPMFLTLLRRLLGGAHDVTTAGSGAEALAWISAGERFDLVLCDLMMPGMSGMDLFEAVSRIAPDQAARFVFLTGGATTPRAAEFLQAHAGAKLDKPFTQEELLRTVNARLEGRE